MRGIYGKTLTEDVMRKIGMAVGTLMVRRDMGSELLIGNDIRTSSPSLSRAFIDGVTSMGINVTNVGTTSFGVTIFSGWKLEKCVSAYITASHNPPEWNGIKFFDNDCIGFFAEDNNEIGRIVVEEDFEQTFSKKGKVEEIDITEDYKNHLKKSFNLKKRVKVVVDCGNGSTAVVVPELFNNFENIDAVMISHNIDPAFPDRGADVEKKNLENLRKKVIEEGADVGVAFDGDGDRVGVVDEKGNVITPEQLMVVVGHDVLSSNTGKANVIANVECSMILENVLEKLGGNIIRIPVGHTFMMQSARKHNAVLGGEPSYHMVIPSHFPFDDAVVPALKIVEILSKKDKKFSELISSIPVYPKDRIYVDCEDAIKFEVMENLKQRLTGRSDKINTMDGIRLDFENGWVLIRASNTSPLIRLTVEAVNETEMEKIKSEFLAELNAEIERVKTVGVSQ